MNNLLRPWLLAIAAIFPASSSSGIAASPGRGSQHSGSIHIQGKDFKKENFNFKWGLDDPILKSQAIDGFTKSVWSKLPASTQKRLQATRDKVFEWIRKQGPLGVDAGTGFNKTFNAGDKEDSSLRIDVEVQTGRAFVHPNTGDLKDRSAGKIHAKSKQDNVNESFSWNKECSPSREVGKKWLTLLWEKQIPKKFQDDFAELVDLMEAELDRLPPQGLMADQSRKVERNGKMITIYIEAGNAFHLPDK